MRVKLNRSSFEAIEGAFLVLKGGKNNPEALQVIKESLEKCFDCEFVINIIPCDESNQSKNLFVMSVYPEMSVIDKIITAVMTDKGTDAVKSLWAKNKKWTIEIDERILDSTVIDCSKEELTAVLLHEVGHIVCSSSIPNRISLILRYEIMKTSFKNKMMLKNKIFRNIMSLPILDACISDNKKDMTSIKEEIKADTFVKKMGYQKELYSVLTKIIKNNKYTSSSSINTKMKEVSDFSLSRLEEFQARKDKIAKSKLISLREGCQSPYINNVIDEFIETVFEDAEDSKSIINGRKVEFMQECADKLIEEGYYTEFFLFGGKKLKRIEPSDIDYIDIKINTIKNDSDKMMIVSYIHSKIDLVDYYISILENPALASKYRIPNSINQLYDMKKRLYQLREIALRYKIPERNKNILVAYPTNYEG